MENYNKNFAVLLRSVRVSRNLRQEDLAAALRINRSTYSYYEGGNTTPHLSQVRILMKVLNLPAEAFIFPENYLSEAPVRRLTHGTSSMLIFDS